MADDRDFKRWPRSGRPCDLYRDEHGFCHLQSRCWSERPCPRTPLEALHAWNEMQTPRPPKVVH
jgi:hypothetical protein